MSNWLQSILTSSTGANLHLYSAVIVEPPKGVVQINHGMGEHAARHESLNEINHDAVMKYFADWIENRLAG